MKVFRITGEINKPKLNTTFVKEVLADKAEHAEEKIYTEIGSKHRVKRCHIKLLQVTEVSPGDIDNPILKKLVAGE